MHITDTNYFPAPSNFSKYTSDAKYEEKPKYNPTNVEQWVDKFTHFFFHTITPSNVIPPGYIVAKGNNTLNLGPKVENHDWADLLNHYKGILILIFFLLVLIIIVPFIAVCYCCFCRCRCKKDGCPLCDIEKNSRKRCCFGYILVLLVVGILFGVIISVASNSSLNHAMGHTSTEMKLATKDTCTYLKDVSDHIHHLFVHNYEELCAHLVTILNGAGQTSYDAFKKNAEIDHYYDLYEKMENMPKARLLMIALSKLLKDLRFYGAQFRDGLREAKRDITYALAVICGTPECLHFLKTSQIQSIDNSKCLHFDKMPDPDKFSAAMEHIIDKNAVAYLDTRTWHFSWMFYSIGVPEYYQQMVDLIIKDLDTGKDLFRSRADRIRAIIDSVISDIHMNSLTSTSSFDDVVAKFGSARSAVSTTVCVLLSTVIIFLIIGLICGCCCRHRRANHVDFCSKGTGSVCLLMAIMLIFCVFSVSVLVGIFYLVIGLVTYQSACALIPDQQENALFRYLDAEIDLNPFWPKTQEESLIPPIRMSNLIKRFQANQSMCDLLETSGLYDIKELSKIKVIQDHKLTNAPYYGQNSSGKNKWLGYPHKTNYKFFTDNDMTEYNSSKFTKQLCKELTPLDLLILANQIMVLRSSLWTQWGIYDWARITLYNEADSLRKLHYEIGEKIKALMDEITRTLSQIDALILLNSSFSYKKSVTGMHKKLDVGERYFWDHCDDFYLEQRNKLPGWMNEFVNTYKIYVQDEFCAKVGKNAPIASIYNRAADIVCERLISPLNRFWVGLLLSSLLFLPVLFLAHHLMCLYKKTKPGQDIEPVIEDGCPYCTAQL